MKNKFILAILNILLLTVGNPTFAEQVTQKLTQDEYNQRIQEYTDQVNSTKHILDEEIQTQQNAAQQRKAFCSRLEAYQAIAQISKENSQLETANMMLIIANNFLDRQKQSMQASGMTLEAFCLIEK